MRKVIEWIIPNDPIEPRVGKNGWLPLNLHCDADSRVDNLTTAARRQRDYGI